MEQAPGSPAPSYDVDVVVVGAGPVGALAANLLGRRGITTLVLERSRTPHGQPRAFSCDDESLRVYQQAGLLDEVRRNTLAPSTVEYINRKRKVFATVALSEVDFGLGHAALHFFDQPRLERTLRTGLERFDHVQLRLGVELVGLEPDDDGVTLTVSDVDTGEKHLVRARYVLGCDGARSTTRSLVGIELAGASYAEPWLAVSGDLPEQAVRVRNTTFVCDWRRPAFVSPGARGTYRLEFMLRPGESETELVRPDRLAALVEPYVDPAQFDVTRAVVYTFHHLLAQRWRQGRVFLLGDAAHQMPPFLGQGLCSGLRDAANLVWKLALVLAGVAAPRLLDTYEVERRPHAAAMAQTSVRLGKVFLARSRGKAWARDNALRALQTVPRIRRFVRHFEFKPVPAHQRGFMAGDRRRGPVGVMFPQPRIAVAAAPDVRLLDEVLGDGFAVIGFEPAISTASRVLRDLPLRFVAIRPSGMTIADRPTGQVDAIDVDGTLSAWMHRHGVELVVLRPDRFVFATASTGGIGRVGRRLSAALA